jgi:hypothetical protein
VVARLNQVTMDVQEAGHESRACLATLTSPLMALKSRDCTSFFEACGADGDELSDHREDGDEPPTFPQPKEMSEERSIQLSDKHRHNSEQTQHHDDGSPQAPPTTTSAEFDDDPDTDSENEDLEIIIQSMINPDTSKETYWKLDRSDFLIQQLERTRRGKTN